jgi:ribosomal-protein-alanine N-acetyltransferase
MPAMSAQDYFLRAARLGFRRWQAEDLPLARALWGNPEVTRLFSREPLTETLVEERLRTEMQQARDHGVQYWPIFLLANDAHVGCCGLRPHRPDEGIYELGFHLLPAHWGAGIASEAAGAVIEHAFSQPGIQGLFAGHHPDNAASGRVLAKLGFTRTGDQLYPPTGLQHPSYMLLPSAGSLAAGSVTRA